MVLSQTFIFCISWAFGSFLEDAGRAKLEVIVEQITTNQNILINILIAHYSFDSKTFMRESTSLKLPSLEKGSSIFDYKVGKYQNCTLNVSSTQVNPHTGDWSHWNSLMENYVPPDEGKANF